MMDSNHHEEIIKGIKGIFQGAFVMLLIFGYEFYIFSSRLPLLRLSIQKSRDFVSLFFLQIILMVLLLYMIETIWPGCCCFVFF